MEKATLVELVLKDAFERGLKIEITIGDKESPTMHMVIENKK